MEVHHHHQQQYEDDLLKPTPLNEMAIGSVDTLRGKPTPLSLPNTWRDQPPLLAKYDRRGKFIPETERLLKGMLRYGIPPALRCAVLLSNVIQATHPHEESSYWHAYRTLAKVHSLDFAYESLLQRIRHTQGEKKETDGNLANDDVWESMPESTFGRFHGDVRKLIPDISEDGSKALKRVLLALEPTLGIEVCPLLPAFCAILLCSMSESYVFTAIREMAKSSSFFMSSSRVESTAWCATFRVVLFKLHPATAEYLEDRGVLDVEGLVPLFQDFGLGVLPLPVVQRMMDIYTLEGYKVLMRFGVALFVLYRKESAEMLVTISNAADWWENFTKWSHSREFDVEGVIRKAYGVHHHVTGLRRQIRFPRRHLLERIIRLEDCRIRQDELLDDDGHYQEPLAQPLGLVQPVTPPLEEPVVALLGQPLEHRQSLAQWLPLSLRLTNLDLLYSTNHHGRTLERFYTHVKRARHTLFLAEVLQDPPTIVGMYASQVWHPSTRVYGDGGCFLFRVDPDPVCFKWHPKDEKLDDTAWEEDSKSQSNNNETALLEQFMVGTNNFISMGGNPDGSSGLRINEDLTRGESSKASGYENDPLHGKTSVVFELGLIEVYGLVRQIDGLRA